MHIEGPRFAKLDEFDSLVKLEELCFSGNRPIDKHYPHVFKNRDECVKNTIVFSQDGNIICALGIYPALMYISGTVLSAASLTFVATHPDYRGRGLMQKAVKLAIGEMKNRNIALSWLVGDRQRYNHFGWETAGRKNFYTITRRSITNLKRKPPTILKYEGEKALLKDIQAIYNQGKARFVRDENLTKMLFERVDKKTFVAVADGIAAAYLTLSTPASEQGEAIVYELGGNAEGVEDILHWCFESMEINKLLIATPMENNPLNKMLKKNASVWNIGAGFLEFPNSGAHMIKILDLRAVLQGFSEQISAKWVLSGYRTKKDITIKIQDINQYATLSFRDTVKVTDVLSKEELTLTEHEMVRLLFGITRPTDEFSAPTVLDQVFPLDFFISTLEDV